MLVLVSFKVSMAIVFITILCFRKSKSPQWKSHCWERLDWQGSFWCDTGWIWSWAPAQGVRDLQILQKQELGEATCRGWLCTPRCSIPGACFSGNCTIWVNPVKVSGMPLGFFMLSYYEYSFSPLCLNLASIYHQVHGRNNWYSYLLLSFHN